MSERWYYQCPRCKRGYHHKAAKPGKSMECPAEKCEGEVLTVRGSGPIGREAWPHGVQSNGSAPLPEFRTASGSKAVRREARKRTKPPVSDGTAEVQKQLAESEAAGTKPGRNGIIGIAPAVLKYQTEKSGKFLIGSGSYGTDCTHIWVPWSQVDEGSPSKNNEAGTLYVRDWWYWRQMADEVIGLNCEVEGDD